MPTPITVTEADMVAAQDQSQNLERIKQAKEYATTLLDRTLEECVQTLLAAGMDPRSVLTLFEQSVQSANENQLHVER